MAECRDGDGNIQRGALGGHFHLGGGHAHAIGAAQQGIEILQHFGGEDIGQGRTQNNLWSGVVRSLGVKHAEQSLIGVGDAARGVERKHSGGNALEDGFHLAAAAVEFSVGFGGVAAGGGGLAGGGFGCLRSAV